MIVSHCVPAAGEGVSISNFPGGGTCWHCRQVLDPNPGFSGPSKHLQMWVCGPQSWVDNGLRPGQKMEISIFLAS